MTDAERKVWEGTAVRITNGSIRSATVSGVFEISNSAMPFDTYAGNLRVEVKCLWFERKPPSSWMHITLGKDWELLRNYTGPVVENIAK